MAKALRLEAWSFRDIEVTSAGGPPQVTLHGAAERARRELGVSVRISLTHTRSEAGAVAIAAPHD